MQLRSLMIMALAFLVSLSLIPQAVAAKKTKQSSPSAVAEQKTGGKQTAVGWKKITTNKPELCEVAYKVAGGAITLKVKNLNRDKSIRVIYTVRCQAQNKNGKWEPYETYPPEGLRMTVKKQDEIEKNIWTNGDAVKDVAFAVSVSDAE